MPNVPVPSKLLIVCVRLQIVAAQNPADACHGTKTHGNPDVARVNESHTARATAFGKIVRIMCTPVLDIPGKDAGQPLHRGRDMQKARPRPLGRPR